MRWVKFIRNCKKEVASMYSKPKLIKTFTEGTRVCYKDFSGKKECGTVSSINDEFVFVKYDGANNSVATKPEDLTIERES